MGMVVFKCLNKVEYFLFDHLLVMFVVYIIHASVDGQYFHSLMPIDPVLMPLVNSL